MLFNSYQFIFIFLPTVVGIYFVLSRFGRQARLALLFTASLLFYGWWDARFIALLVFSMTTNFLIGQRLISRTSGQIRTGRFWLAFGVGLNLLVLGAFKYANFFAANVDLLTGTHFSFGSIILPLGISFFTFEQIGYLVDINRGHRYPADPLSYAVFVSFFPRLVAGPILRYSEIEPQLAPSTNPRFSIEDLAVGLTIFFIGLAKKSFLADGIAPYVLPGFSAAHAGNHVEFFTAWGSVLAYTCQLYFDFSGYSDMAIGAARCFGIVFPLNFASPYKSLNIVEFWRRWHITLSRFLRDYLYIPLGGNRNGKLRRYGNLLLTMLLGGLWHGANWTFVCWGGLHGIYLIINHGWDVVARKTSFIARLRTTFCWRLTAWFLTFTAVVIGWVFFRSPDFTTAVHLLNGMTGGNGAYLPNALLSLPRPVRRGFSSIGVHFGFGSGATFVSTYLWVAALLFIALIMPNTQELLARFNPALSASPDAIKSAGYGRWSLSPGWAVAFGSIAFIGIISITRVSEFLYWQF